MKTDVALLKKCYPFDHCSDVFCETALRAGTVAEFNRGDNIFPSGDTSGRRGLLLQGEVMVLRSDAGGQRYRVCPEAGCYLDSAEKANALTDVLILVWDKAAYERLCRESADFDLAMLRLADGLKYQKTYLIPDTDLSEPILCAEKPHWLTLTGSVILAAVLLGLVLWACGMLFRYYAAAIAAALPAVAVTAAFLFRRIGSQMNDRLILSTRSLILFSGKDRDVPKVIPLGEIESVEAENTLLFPEIGRLQITTADESFKTFYVEESNDLCCLITDFAPRAADNKRQAALPVPADTPSDSPDADPDADAEPDEIVLHAHWAMLLSLILKPLILLGVFQALRGVSFGVGKPGTALNVLSLFCLISVFYRICEWRSHRFVITKDCIRDCCRKPLLKEDVAVSPLRKVQSVRYKKEGFFQVLLNYGTVYILAGEGELNFDYVPNPKKVQSLILERCKTE